VTWCLSTKYSTLSFCLGGDFDSILVGSLLVASLSGGEMSSCLVTQPITIVIAVAVIKS